MSTFYTNFNHTDYSESPCSWRNKLWPHRSCGNCCCYHPQGLGAPISDLERCLHQPTCHVMASSPAWRWLMLMTISVIIIYFKMIPVWYSAVHFTCYVQLVLPAALRGRRHILGLLYRGSHWESGVTLISQVISHKRHCRNSNPGGLIPAPHSYLSQHVTNYKVKCFDFHTPYLILTTTYLCVY